MNLFKRIVIIAVRWIAIVAIALLVVAFAGLVFIKVAQAAALRATCDDGPYFFHDKKTVRSFSLEESPSGEIAVVAREFDCSTVEGQRNAAESMFEGFNPLETFSPAETNVFVAEKIAAIGDIHGAYKHFRLALAANKIIDAQDNWSWGNGHLVIVGDVMDKGPHVTECLWLIRKLEVQAEKHGGKVHFLLGNHETMLLLGNIQHTPVKYRKICERLGMNYAQLFGTDAYLGRWLRTRSAAVRINNVLFVHGGISRKLVQKGHTLDQLNGYIRARLNDNAPDDPQTAEAARFLFSYFGPFEYKGYFNNNLLSRGESSKLPVEAVDEALKHFKADHMVVGHTIVRKIKTLFDHRVIAIDVRLPQDDAIDGDSEAELLVIENGNFFRTKANGSRSLLFSSTRQPRAASR